MHDTVRQVIDSEVMRRNNTQVSLMFELIEAASFADYGERNVTEQKRLRDIC